MRIAVIAKTHAKKRSVEEIEQQILALGPILPTYRVSVTEAPENGQANKAIIEAIAEHFGIARSCVSITSGHTSSHKVLELLL